MMIFIDLIRYGGHITFPSALYGAVYICAQVIGLLFVLLYLHQFVYIIVSLFKKFKERHVAEREHSIGIVIAARNESAVIANLIDSIKKNDYPADKVRIFVVADNCTDDTAEICRSLGCTVFERFDDEHIGKGYALHYLFEKLHTDPQYAEVVPEAYIVVDADNLLKPDFISQMNRSYDSGYDMVTCYRNTKNMGANWIAAGYGYWYLHENCHLSNARRLFKNSCMIRGTGFLVSAEVVKEFGNWSFFTLVEDNECTTEYVLSGRKVGYAPDAELYDEQPVKFSQAWRQRVRWARGYYQVFAKCGGRLLKGCFKNFSCYDILTDSFAATVLSILSVVLFPVLAVVSACLGDYSAAIYSLISLAATIGGMMLTMLFLGVCTVITEWKKIGLPWYKKILYIFTFPLYMVTYIPIAIVAIFKKVEWKPIAHTDAVGIEELEDMRGARKKRRAKGGEKEEAENMRRKAVLLKAERRALKLKKPPRRKRVRTKRRTV